MAAVLPDFVPPWRATCFRGFRGGGFPGGVLFEQQMQTAAAISDVQKNNGIKGDPRTLCDSTVCDKVTPYSESIFGLGN